MEKTLVCSQHINAIKLRADTQGCPYKTQRIQGL